MIEEKKKSSVGKAIGIFILIIACLALGAGASYYYLTEVKDVADKDTTSNKDLGENAKKETLDNDDPLVQSLFSKMVFADKICTDHIYEDVTNKNLDNNTRLQLIVNQIPEKDFVYYNYNCKDSDFAFEGSGLPNCAKLQEFLEQPDYLNRYPITAVSEALVLNKSNELFGTNVKIELTSFVGFYYMDYIYNDNKLVKIHPWGVGGTCGPDDVVRYALGSATKEGNIITLNLNITLGDKLAGSQVMRFEKDDNGSYIFKDVKSNNDYTEALKTRLTK